MAAPALRASGAQLTLQLIDALPEPAKTRIRDRIPSAVLASVAGATSLAWLPLATHSALVNAVNSVLEADDQRKFQQQMSKQYANLPLIKPVVSLAVRIGAISPKGLLKTMPVSWGLTARDCGKIQFVDSPERTQASLLLTEVPDEVFNQVGFLSSMSAGLRVVFELCNAQGTVTPLVEPSRHQITFSFQWFDR